MKTNHIVLCALFTATACSVAEPPDANDAPFPEAAAEKAELIEKGLSDTPAQVAAPTPPPRATEFRVGAAARKLVPSGVINRRPEHFDLGNKPLPRLQFATVDTPAETAKLRKRVNGFMSGTTWAGAQIEEAALDVSQGLLQIRIPEKAGFAFANPESGAFTIKRPIGEERRSSIRDAAEAVAVSLDAVANAGLLELAPKESLEVLGVTARMHGGSSESAKQEGEAVAYRVLLGRAYGGVPVIGPPTMVTLDSAGQLSAFRKGWRDIVGESGRVAVVGQSVADSRRDQLMSSRLALKHNRCGYIEDPDAGALQGSPGVGCVYTYLNPAASDPLQREVEDWVNLADDAAALPLRGSKAL